MYTERTPSLGWFPKEELEGRGPVLHLPLGSTFGN